MKLRVGLLSAVSSLAIIGFASQATAADLPLKGVAPYRIPVASWQGAYVGGSLGVGRYDTNMFFHTESGVCADNGGETCHTSATGVMGGFQVGYNFQSGHYVYGVEGDWMWTGLKEKNASQSSSAYFTQAEMGWVATFRGRMGLAVDKTLAYVTGGLALAEIKSHWGGSGYQANDGSRLKAGWVAGVGIEHQFNDRWSVKGEVLYHDFGRETLSHFEPYNTGTYTTTYSHTLMTAKVGINYKLPW
jgi:outer membrane immunogenic protein